MDQHKSLRLLVADLNAILPHDVEIKCSGGFLTASSLMLKARSPVFNAMFSGNFEPPRVIDLGNCSIATARRFLDYIHSGTFSYGDTAAEDLELYSLADKYIMDHLRANVHREMLICAGDRAQYCIKVLYHLRAGDYDLPEIERAAIKAIPALFMIETAALHQLDLDELPTEFKAQLFEIVARARGAP